MLDFLKGLSVAHEAFKLNMKNDAMKGTLYPNTLHKVVTLAENFSVGLKTTPSYNGNDYRAQQIFYQDSMDFNISQDRDEEANSMVQRERKYVPRPIFTDEQTAYLSQMGNPFSRPRTKYQDNTAEIYI